MKKQDIHQRMTSKVFLYSSSLLLLVFEDATKCNHMALYSLAEQNAYK